jgi:hypothetical protein
MKTNVLLILAIVICAASSQAAPLKQYNVDQATSLFKQKHYAEALKHFRALLKSSKRKQQTIRLQWNVARCLEQLGRHEEALTEFYGYQSIVKDSKRKKRAKTKIGKLIPKVYGTLKVTCPKLMSLTLLHVPTAAPDQPETYARKKCPTTLKKLRAGRTQITAVYDGDDIRRSAVITPGTIQKIHLTIPPPKADNTLLIAGVVTTAVVIGASIYLLTADDGKGETTNLCFDCP